VPGELPRAVELVGLPLLNLAIALAAAALVVAAVGQSPLEVLGAMWRGAFGSTRGIGYTLYYATSFVFTGLAVAVAFHAGLFNIGGEGQAMVGGIGTALAGLALGAHAPAWVVLPAMLLAGVAAGVAWAAVPAWLQAWRGSHIVITTIMFNFLAASLSVYLLVNHLKPADSMAVQSADFAAAAQLPKVHEVLAALGIEWGASALNLSVLLAAAAAVAVYLFLWRTNLGYRLRAVGSSPGAAEYAGTDPRRMVLLAMAVSGGLAALVAMNQLAGVSHRLLLDFTAGAGFTGIAVALMGRNHPVGIVLASLLFGALFQGGAEVAFEVSGFSRDMVVVLQGFIVLFTGALAGLGVPMLRRLVRARAAGAPVAQGAGGG
jgi:simple sugar transport system permease protein